MKKILEKIKRLRKGRVKKLIDKRVKEFKRAGKSSKQRIFSELCFCILTANYSAEGGIRIQKEIGNGFLKMGEKALAKKLKKLGHRFPNTRAKFIVEARKKFAKKIKEIVFSFDDGREAREWLVKNVKGLGYKEASHFLRNVGFMDLGIVDFHIVDLLVKNRMIKKPKAITRKKYFEIEGVLKKLAERTGLEPGELDLYLWYIETGKVL
ncbi:MAG: N-glycosylase/DNA lyase, partial [Candidatus Anstonellales archaeon]